tara:strand:- start:581 stop:811 length:231 start_codon:yes stop_codon:yes gene_type:complete
LLITQHNQLLLVNIIFTTVAQEAMSIAHRMIILAIVIAIQFLTRLLLIMNVMLNIATTGILAGGRLMTTAVIKEKK